MQRLRAVTGPPTSITERLGLAGVGAIVGLLVGIALQLARIALSTSSSISAFFLDFERGGLSKMATVP